MDNSRHFKAWLRMVRRYDWSPRQRQASALRAFAALQQAVSKCETGSLPAAARQVAAPPATQPRP